MRPSDLRQLQLPYRDFNGKAKTGVLIVHKDVAAEVVEIFMQLFEQRFPIARLEPVENFGGSDDRSMDEQYFGVQLP